MLDTAKVSPSILSADFLHLGEDLDRVANADYIHVDVMDGHFVPNLSYGTTIVEAVRRATDLPIDVHMMVSNPDDTIDWYVDAGADLITVHYEAATDLSRIIDRLHDRGLAAGVVLNPATPVYVLEDVLTRIDLVLIMSVNPGFGGQGFIEETYEKLRRLKRLCHEVGADPLIQVDGGVGTANARKLGEAGADVLVAGSAVFRAEDPGQVVNELRELATEGIRSGRAAL